jgi:regulator of protease activity HflC (stomatin/prohibitin superfamily)
MGATEYGVRFRKLPPVLGGGVGSPSSVASPLQTIVVFPWESIYRFDTSPQYLSWGRGMGDGGGATQVVQNEDVHTRAKDGNEAALKLTVRYRIDPNPERLVKLVQEVSTTDAGVRDLVVSVVRSEIRTNMNLLRTPEFRDDKKRNDAVDAALAAARSTLSPWGIDVEAINLKQYRFVRLLRDGSEDTSYQDRLRDIQEKEQDIEGERTRIETVRAKKHTEYSEAESKYNARIAEARGYKEQSAYQGDGYYAAKANEAKAIKAEGDAEIEGLRQQIAALSGKGGRAMLRLEVAKQLSQGNPSFVAVNPGQSAGIEVSKTDMNQLIQQLGVAEGLVAPGSSAQTGAAAASAKPAAQSGGK